MRLMSMMVVITSFDVSLVYIISDIISEIISIALFVCLVKNMLVAFWFLWHWWQRFLVFISFLVVGFRSHVYYWNSLKGSKRGQKKITLLDDPWVTLWSPPDFVVVWIFRRFLLFLCFFVKQTFWILWHSRNIFSLLVSVFLLLLYRFSGWSQLLDNLPVEFLPHLHTG